MTTRLKEAQKLGFKRAVLPAAGEIEAGGAKITLQRLSHLKELAEQIGPCQ
jgi:predicted ATP-dependent serine protease